MHRARASSPLSRAGSPRPGAPLAPQVQEAMDTLMLFIENDIEQVECVQCKHRFSEPKEQGGGSERQFDQVIGVFKPD